MSHPFGDLVSQHLHRKHGLRQARLAEGILQDPALILADLAGQSGAVASRNRGCAARRTPHDSNYSRAKLLAGKAGTNAVGSGRRALLDKDISPDELRDELHLLVDGYVNRIRGGVQSCHTTKLCSYSLASGEDIAIFHLFVQILSLVLLSMGGR